VDSTLTQPRRHRVLSWLALWSAYIVSTTAAVTLLMMETGDTSSLTLGEIVPWIALVTGVAAVPAMIVTMVVRPPLDSRRALVAAFPCICLLFAAGVLASPLATVSILIPVVGPFVLVVLCLILTICGSVFGAVGLARRW